jgi:hypothetical protein
MQHAASPAHSLCQSQVLCSISTPFQTFQQVHTGQCFLFFGICTLPGSVAQRVYMVPLLGNVQQPAAFQHGDLAAANQSTGPLYIPSLLTYTKVLGTHHPKPLSMHLRIDTAASMHLCRTFHRSLKPWQHYVPLPPGEAAVAAVEKAVARLKEDDRLAQNITRNAQGWAAK